jgi:DNA-binding CsgD family transcriptional regulator
MPDLSLDDYDRLLQRIYAAAVQPTLWEEVLRDLSSLMDGSIMVMQAHDTLRNASLGEVTSGGDPEFQRLYDKHFGAVNVWVPGMAALPIGTVGFPEMYLSAAELARSEFYNDFLRRFGVSTASGIALNRSPDRFLFLAGNIMAPNADAVQARMGSALQRLAPHISRAFEFMRLAPPLDTIGSFTNALGASAVPLFALTAQARPVYVNAAGESLLAERNLLRCQDRVLVSRDPIASERIAAACRDAAAGLLDTGAASLAVRQVGGLPAIATIVPLRRAANEIDTLLSSAFSQIPVALLVVQPARDRRPNDLAREYRLTTAEHRLAEAIAAGVSPREFAEAREVSMNTVRSQLKAVYAKTGTSRQSQLAAMFVRRS